MSNPVKNTKEPEVIKQDVQAVQDTKPTVILSHTDAYIHERVKAQPKTLDEVDIQVEEKIGADKHRLSLPEEIKKHFNRYAFRWIYKHPRAISDACDLRGWVLLNRTHFPELPGHLFSVTGSVERGSNILAFMKREKAERYRREVGERSTLQVKSRIGAHKENPEFYVPKDKSEDDGSSKVIGL